MCFGFSDIIKANSDFPKFVFYAWAKSVSLFYEKDGQEYEGWNKCKKI